MYGYLFFNIFRLARSICQQIKERLRHSHDTFSLALKQLETRHTGRLEKTEEQRLKVRKIHAPKVARLALESTSLKDYILYGTFALSKLLEYIKTLKHTLCSLSCTIPCKLYCNFCNMALLCESTIFKAAFQNGY